MHPLFPYTLHPTPYTLHDGGFPCTPAPPHPHSLPFFWSKVVDVGHLVFTMDYRKT
ncbi:hypothetical protein H6G72_19455 [Planktothricoides sp. FACHB-1370]|uniref:Uncharacterized protein n=1 Tax=Planktothricoides raciborskii FACHB-1370 TaxID=2949576 RepID=A0ABR8EH77_9CYAN|nr:hypothetical protein [Planktothricoides raciborskii FACHB-1370]